MSSCWRTATIPMKHASKPLTHSSTPWCLKSKRLATENWLIFIPFPFNGVFQGTCINCTDVRNVDTGAFRFAKRALGSRWRTDCSRRIFHSQTMLPQSSPALWGLGWLCRLRGVARLRRALTASAHSRKEINRMLQRPSAESRQPAITIFSIALFGLAVTGCVSAEERQYRDTNTCQSFGAPYGSRAYTNCMLEQQARRDNAQRESLERTRLTQEIARNAQVATDRARWDRCRRDPDRRECRQ